MSFTIGSVFSGIAGIELGLEWAGLGPVLWQVECDPNALLVLATHWPEVKRYARVEEVGRSTLAAVDIICGGFPCQDISSAGPGDGLGGARSGLWSHFHRIVRELRPSWVVVENVASGAARWVDAIIEGLDELGYDCLPVPLAAADLGAPHERARVFVVAAYHAGIRRGTRGPGLAQHDALVRSAFIAPHGPDDNVDIHDVSGRHVPHARRRSWWAVEPDVARVVHGLPGRLDRHRLIGNSVVPHCAEVIGWIIRELCSP